MGLAQASFVPAHIGGPHEAGASPGPAKKAMVDNQAGSAELRAVCTTPRFVRSLQFPEKRGENPH
jgi:hypothetical protein